jgi:aryl-alcohol dehydrogenase-like predicted oxidoreductase
MTATAVGRATLAIGAMNFGKRTPEKEAKAIIARAIERGITFFDTANAYTDGESERIVGRAVKGMRDQVRIATKVGFGRTGAKPEGLSRTRVLAAIDESLTRLGTDFVDVYYLHVPDRDTPIAETLDAIAELIDKKKIRAWAVSNYASWQILEMMLLADARNMQRPAMSQQLYNVLIRQLDVEYFKFTDRFPIHTTIYNPLAGGLLSGKHRAESKETIPGSRFENNKLYQGRYWSDAMFGRVEQLSSLAKEEGMSLIELSYAWLARRTGVDSIIVGPASIAHLDAAIDAGAKMLSDEARAKIDVMYRAWIGTDASYAR